MTKRSAKELNNSIDIDFESLLSENENFSPEKASFLKERKRVKCSKPSKNEKPKRIKPSKESEEEDEDESSSKNEKSKRSKPVMKVEEEEHEDEPLKNLKTVKNRKNDIGKPVKAKKAALDDFSCQVMEVYKTKAFQLRRKHESEEKECRTKFMNEIDKELEKLEEDMNKVMAAGEEAMQMIQQHLKKMEKTKSLLNSRKKNLLKISKNFEEQREELAGKHENEIGESLESAKSDISELQTKLISDIKKEEIASMKRLCSQMLL